MSDITTSASPRPSVTDDDGTGRTGTRWNKAFNDAWTDSVNEQVKSATSPAIKPADTIDEVVTARGTKASLDARLDVSLNEDGTPKASAFSSYATIVQTLGGIGALNLVTNDDDQIWVLGDTSAPNGETIGGVGAAVQRCGTGLADTTRKVGDFCARLTRAGADASLTAQLLAGAAFTRADFVKGLYAAGGCWVKCSTPNAARIGVYDGAGTTYSSYHTGGGTWEWLTATRLVDNAATELTIIRQVNNAAVAAYFSGRVVMLLDQNVAIPRWNPCPTTYGAIHFAVVGTVAVLANAGRFMPARPAIIKYVQAHVKTCPTVTDIILDINTWDGVAYTSMFTAGARPTILAAAYDGGSQPDGTYARRCLDARVGNTANAGGEITMDVDQVGGGVAGADMAVEARVLQYMSPLERFQTY
jgi:hypothetical protein